MECDEIKTILKQHIPDAFIIVTDTTGTGDHFRVEVASSVFENKSLIEQHRVVQDPLTDALKDGRIHALSIKTTVLISQTGAR